MQERTLKDLPHWEQRGLGPGPTLHHHGNKEDWDLALPYIAMGYRMSKHVFLFHFFPYFLLFGRHPIPPSSIVAQMDQVMDLDSLAT
jgi:hypothetical protein